MTDQAGNGQNNQKPTTKASTGPEPKQTAEQEVRVLLIRSLGQEPTQQQVNHALAQKEALGF